VHAVASVRKGLATRQPKLKRGRPTTQSRPLVRQRQRLQAKVADLFTHRYLFVQRHLTPSERETLHRITRGLPSTSNAVERGNRRHRKMQKTVYRVRTGAHIHDRLALDLFREARASPRGQTLQALHTCTCGKCRCQARAAPRQPIPR
jgi:hypothetical protein